MSPDRFDAATAFRALTNPNGPACRAVLDVLAEAAELFTTELSEGALLDSLRERGDAIDDLGSLRSHLEELEADGVVARRVNDQLASMDDLRRRSLYWFLTGVGRAVISALRDVEGAHTASGSLQLTTLHGVEDGLRRLAELDLDRTSPEEVFALVTDVLGRQATFTEEAARYVTRLNDVDDDADDELRFHARKAALRGYLQSFLAKLDDVAPSLATATAAITEHSVDGPAPIDALLDLAATTSDLPPATDSDDPPATWRAEASRKFTAIHDWYAAATPRLMSLHDAAHGHALGLTRLLSVINRHRHGSRRTADQLLDAAAFVATASNEDDALRRFTAVTALHPAIHLQLPHEDPELVDPADSWLTALPVEVPVSLRDNAMRNPPGRVGKLVDRSAQLRHVREERRRRQETARRLSERLSQRGRFHLSDLPKLQPDEFELLLSLLAAALDARPREDGVRVGTDQRTGLTATLTPPIGDRPAATVLVGHHRFTGPDHLVDIQDRAADSRLEVVT